MKYFINYNDSKKNSKSDNLSKSNKDLQVQECIFSFWTGSNKITPNRLEGLKSIKEITGVEHVLITVDTLPKYLLKLIIGCYDCYKLN